MDAAGPEPDRLTCSDGFAHKGHGLRPSGPDQPQNLDGPSVPIATDIVEGVVVGLQSLPSLITELRGDIARTDDVVNNRVTNPRSSSRRRTIVGVCAADALRSTREGPLCQRGPSARSPSSSAKSSGTIGPSP